MFQDPREKTDPRQKILDKHFWEASRKAPLRDYASSTSMINRASFYSPDNSAKRVNSSEIQEVIKKRRIDDRRWSSCRGEFGPELQRLYNEWREAEDDFDEPWIPTPEELWSYVGANAYEDIWEEDNQGWAALEAGEVVNGKAW